jgi:hypothetical protein
MLAASLGFLVGSQVCFFWFHYCAVPTGAGKTIGNLCASICLIGCLANPIHQLDYFY